MDSMAQDVTTMYEHIEIDQTGVPLIAGTTMKVVELVTSHLAYGWSPEELHFQFPHLTLGEIYAALAYYWDHKADIDADMIRRERYVEELEGSRAVRVDCGLRAKVIWRDRCFLLDEQVREDHRSQLHRRVTAQEDGLRTRQRTYARSATDLAVMFSLEMTFYGRPSNARLNRPFPAYFARQRK